MVANFQTPITVRVQGLDELMADVAALRETVRTLTAWLAAELGAAAVADLMAMLPPDRDIVVNVPAPEATS